MRAHASSARRWGHVQLWANPLVGPTPLLSSSILSHRVCVRVLGVPCRYAYFIGATPAAILNGLAAGGYIGLKCLSLLKCGKLLVAAARLVLQQGALYGEYLGKEEAAEAALQCPVCQVSRRLGAPSRIHTSEQRCAVCAWARCRGMYQQCALLGRRLLPPW